MLNHVKRADVPDDPSREFVAFSNSISHRVLHNDLVTKLRLHQEQLETAKTTEELWRQQGAVSAIREALEVLHKRNSRDINKVFGYE